MWCFARPAVLCAIVAAATGHISVPHVVRAKGYFVSAEPA
jgi:hypothetical protein